jgi:hypothetical protein
MEIEILKYGEYINVIIVHIGKTANLKLMEIKKYLKEEGIADQESIEKLKSESDLVELVSMNFNREGMNYE